MTRSVRGLTSLTTALAPLRTHTEPRPTATPVAFPPPTVSPLVPARPVTEPVCGEMRVSVPLWSSVTQMPPSPVATWVISPPTLVVPTRVLVAGSMCWTEGVVIARVGSVGLVLHAFRSA